MIDHLHPQRLAYNEVGWCTTKLKLLFEKVCKNSIFVLRGGGNVEYDIDYYKSLIEGGYVKDNDLWIFWMKTCSLILRCFTFIARKQLGSRSLVNFTFQS